MLQPHEAGCLCPLLLEAMRPGQEIAECSVCGVLHDHAAWKAMGGCSTASCAAQPDNRSMDPTSVIRIADRDIWGPRPTTARPDGRTAPPPPPARDPPETRDPPSGRPRVIVEFEIQTAGSPRVVRLRKLPCSIGSADTNDIRLRHPSVRSHHARILWSAGSLCLQQSRGSGPQSAAPDAVGQRLSDGGRFQIGDLVVTVRFRRVAQQPVPPLPPSTPSPHPTPPAPPPPPPPPPAVSLNRHHLAPPPPPPAPPSAPPSYRRSTPPPPPPPPSPPPTLMPIRVPAFPPVSPTAPVLPALSSSRISVQPIRRTVAHGDPVRTCPYSLEMLVPGSRVAECPRCGQVLMEAAWDENQGCTTYGCDGAPDFRKDRL
jgi:hypothetical protein